MHLVLIVGNYGDHWQYLPTVARSRDRLFLLADHRTPLAHRCAALADAIDVSQIESFEYIVSDPPTAADCDTGVHLWEPVNRGPVTIAGCCSFCSVCETLPFPVPAPEVRDLSQAV